MRITMLTLAAAVSAATAAPAGANYDESKIPAYSLPDPLVCADGTPVKTAADWNDKRRPELLALIEKEMFGKAPPRPPLSFKVDEEPTAALDGKVLRKQVSISLNGKPDGPA